MKMVKSLLLGAAAGVVAVSGAQAADLPVKAKPVEYVKVCSLYGAGFYYIPGTDICVKYGGFIRWQESVHSGDSPTFGPFGGAGGIRTRTANPDYIQRTRAVMTMDTRQQTQYGTLRTYFLWGFNCDAGTQEGPSGCSAYGNRAFIQIAGFTFGIATSFFDFFASAAVAYNAGYLHTSDTGDGGKAVAAYTAQLGNGVSATISVEQARERNVVNEDNFINIPATSNPTGSNLFGSNYKQDIVGNIRVDQAWGSAQISAAAHNASASYYDTTAKCTTFCEWGGHPDDKWGWAVSGGLRLNAPMIAQGDYFQTQVIYSEGAIKYASNTPSGRSLLSWQGDSVGWGFFTDGVFGGVSSTDPDRSEIQLTTAWSVGASYEHNWTPSLKTSVYGNYLDVSYNQTAINLICTGLPTLAPTNGCDPDFSAWAVGSRTQWSPVKGLIVGLDLTYLYLNTAKFDDSGFVFAGANAQSKPSAFYRVDDQEAWAATWRIQRDVVP